MCTWTLRSAIINNYKARGKGLGCSGKVLGRGKMYNKMFRWKNLKEGDHIEDLCTAMYRYVPLCTAMYRYVPLCNAMYRYVPLCTAMYSYVPLCTTMHRYVTLCTAMYSYVSLCTAMYGSDGYIKDLKQMGLCRLHFSGSGQGQVAGSFEHCHHPLGYMKRCELLDK
jgi:hypothetical protein